MHASVNKNNMFHVGRTIRDVLEQEIKIYKGRYQCKHTFALQSDFSDVEVAEVLEILLHSLTLVEILNDEYIHCFLRQGTYQFFR